MFLYEMHQHTAGVSACAMDSPEDTVRGLKRAGYAGMVLTNHFYHGNTGVRRQQQWSDFVRPFELAYRQAKAVGDALDFDVLFGIEEGIGKGKEVLLYGIEPSFLYNNPDLRRVDLATLSALVHAAGGLVVQAHPFRVRDYIPAPWEELPAKYLDGIEVYNACNDDLSNMRARQFADAHGLFPIAGSDAHTADTPYRAGIACEHRLRTNEELVAVLHSGAYDLYIPE